MTTARSATPFTLLYDGECPLCVREAGMLRRMDRGRGRLVLVDITAPAFDPTPFPGGMAALMGQIHGYGPDRSIVTGVEVFRRAYAVVGFGWMASWTAWPGFRPLVDAAYRWFARNRLRLFGRQHCADGRCAVGR